MRISNILTAGAVTVALAGCGHAEDKPAALNDAHDVYAQAEQDQAGQYAPVKLEEARRAISKAEGSWSDDAKSQETQDLSYIAHRRALIAEYATKQAKSSQFASKTREQQINLTAQQKESLERQVEQQGQSLTKTKAELDKARADAERARADLARIGATKVEPDRIVLTLSGAVLFKSNDASLLPSAQAKLSEVAEVLKREDKPGIQVVGHTDSRGSTESNQVLSQQRAQAVVDYFVTQGVTKDVLEARGMGEAQPVADNESAEGRANNRRVEIIIPKTPEPH